MYFPYLRGRENEALALLQLGLHLATNRRVTPILEPVQRGKTDGMFRRIVSIAQTGVPLGLVVNPSKGDFKDDARPVHEELLIKRLSGFANVIPVMLVEAGLDGEAIQAFVKRYENREVGLVHVGMASRPESIRTLLGDNVKFQLFRDNRITQHYRTMLRRGLQVRLVDGFNKRPRNSEYPDVEFFSDALRTFRADGFDGFGDYLIVGDQYDSGGGPPLAVALHLTNRENGGDVWAHHFISDRTKDIGVDTAGKFLEALTKLVRFVQSDNNALVSEGCRQYIRHYEKRHSPGLGVAKRLSMMHHIELMDASLQ